MPSTLSFSRAPRKILPWALLFSHSLFSQLKEVRVDFGSWFKDSEAWQGTDSMAPGKCSWQTTSPAEKGKHWGLACLFFFFFLFIQPRAPVHGVALPTLRLAVPYTVKCLWRQPHRCVKRCVFWVFPNSQWRMMTSCRAYPSLASSNLVSRAQKNRSNPSWACHSAFSPKVQLLMKVLWF